MPFLGSQIAVSINHTVEPRAEMPIETQVLITDYLLSRQFAGTQNLLIKVEKVGVYSADYHSTKE